MDDIQDKLARVARDTILELMSRGIPALPGSYRDVFLELCRQRGLPESALGEPAGAPAAAGDDSLQRELTHLVLALTEVLGLSAPGHDGIRAVQEVVRSLTASEGPPEPELMVCALRQIDRLNLELQSGPPTAGGGDAGPLLRRFADLLRALVPLADPEGAERETALPALNGLAGAQTSGDAGPHLEAMAVFAVARRKAVTAELMTAKLSQRRVAELMNLADAVLEFLNHVLPGGAEVETLITGARDRIPRADPKALAELRLELLSHLSRFQGVNAPVQEQKTVIKGVLRTLADQLAQASTGSVQFEQVALQIRQRVEAANDLTELRQIQDLLVREAATAASEAGRMRAQLGELSSQVSNSQQQIDSLERALVETKQAMNVDPLTRVPNRRALNDWVDATLYPPNGAARGFSLLVLDLDHFKKVNDTHGHLAGDAVLAETAKRVKLGIRDVDMLARYGGEEFVLVLPDCDLNIAKAVAERMCALVSRRPVTHAALTIPVTTSIGVAHKRPGETFQEVFERADQCVYLAKQGGRNRSVTEIAMVTAEAS